MNIPFVTVRSSRMFFIILLAVFTVSIMSFLIFKPNKKIILFYPADNLEVLSAEIRNVPPVSGQESRMLQVVQELLLHPASVNLNPVVPEGVRVNFLIYNNVARIVYLDLSSELVIIDRATGNYPEDKAMLSIIEQNLLYHFPKLDKIQITVDSKVPFHPLYMENMENSDA